MGLPDGELFVETSKLGILGKSEYQRFDVDGELMMSWETCATAINRGEAS